MKPLLFGLFFALSTTMASAQSEPQKQTQGVQVAVATTASVNPNIDMEGYLKVAKEAAEYRVTHRVPEAEFLKMSGEKGTVILDARSKELFDMMHIDGAINLTFSDIAVDSLTKTFPDKEVRILIYCNNNIRNASGAFPTKKPTASLNLATFIALYNYGYRNVYELAPIIDPKESKIPFVGNAKK